MRTITIECAAGHVLAGPMTEDDFGKITSEELEELVPGGICPWVLTEDDGPRYIRPGEMCMEAVEPMEGEQPCS